MKNKFWSTSLVLFKLTGLFCFLLVLTTCKKESMSEDQKLTQHEQKIITIINDFMPTQIATMFEDHLKIKRNEQNYSFYLDSLETSINELKSTIQLNFSIDDYKKALDNTLSNFKKKNSFGCLGLGYAKGVEVDPSLSGSIGAGIIVGLQAAGGGGVQTVYDFVNMERQVYYYTFCSEGYTFGIGIAAILSASIGFSGVNELITGINYHGSSSGLNQFEGAGLSKSYSLSSDLAEFFGIDFSAGIGISNEVVADFSGVNNLMSCPTEMVEIENGSKEYSFEVSGTVSESIGAELVLAYSSDKVGSYSYGAKDTYKKFSTDRALAGIRMATELLLLDPITGIKTVINPFDEIASTVAVAYGLIDVTSCPATVPSIGTRSIKDITITSATCGGIITNNCGSNIIARGIVWSISENPTIANSKTNDGTGIGTFTSSLTGLLGGTTYYLRAYATNSAGTSYGNQVSFTTTSNIQNGNLIDVDGNSYNMVTIGTQIWMKQNLKVTKYNDGTVIPNVTDASQWNNLTTGAYCWYDNNSSNKDPYGALYNWYTVGTGKLCPIGWHVPSQTEWNTLLTYLGGASTAGAKLKETGTSHWKSPNTATNESGFNALPGGARALASAGIVFWDLGDRGSLWSSTQAGPGGTWGGGAWEMGLYSGPEAALVPYTNFVGQSVRCIKNN